MKVFACPSCGAPVNFASAITVFAVCASCKSMIVRRDVDVESLGKMAVLLEDLSPLQIGCGGKFETVNFTVIGRVKVEWDEGAWNEWYVFFDDGRFGWLAEAQGFWMMSFPVSDVPAPSQKTKVGAAVMIHGKRFVVDDRREAWCQASEGELPFRAVPGRRTLRLDMTGADGTFACAEYDQDEGVLYQGRYFEFDECQFMNLRELPGWKYERAG